MTDEHPKPFKMMHRFWIYDFDDSTFSWDKHPLVTRYIMENILSVEPQDARLTEFTEGTYALGDIMYKCRSLYSVAESLTEYSDSTWAEPRVIILSAGVGFAWQSKGNTCGMLALPRAATNEDLYKKICEIDFKHKKVKKGE